MSELNIAIPTVKLPNITKNDVVTALSAANNLKMSEAIFRSSIKAPLSKDSSVGIEGDSQVDHVIWHIIRELSGIGFMPPGYNNSVDGTAIHEMLDSPRFDNFKGIGLKLAFLMTGANDIREGGDAQTIFNGIRQWWRECKLAGIDYIFIFQTPPATTGSFAYTTSQEEQRVLLNQLRSQIDHPDVIVEPSVDWMTPDLFHDGLHMSWDGGAQRIARVGHIIRGFFEPVLPYFTVEESDNIFFIEGDNPQLTGTSGTNNNPPDNTITGPIASGYYVSAVGLDIVCSIVADHFGPGLHAQKLECTGSGSYALRFRRQYSTTINGVIGDAFEAYYQFELEPGHTGVRNISASCGTGETPAYDRALTIEGGVGYKGTLRTGITQALAADDSNDTPEFFMRLDHEGTPINFTVLVGMPYLKKVTNLL